MELGFGTWKMTDADECREAVEHALNTGYRHVDTAQVYQNESHVGEGIHRSEVDREDLFIASKVWNTNLIKRQVISSTKSSLDKMGLKYLDMMYIHWPGDLYQPDRTLQGFKALKNRGIIREIGVSNFDVSLLEEALEFADIYANQVEIHPLLPQKDLRDYCSRVGVELVAYSPLARGDVFDVPEIQSVADKHGVSEAQVSLAWIMEKGGTPIPKSSNKAHIEENFRARELVLDSEDISKIDSIQRTERKIDPTFSPWS